MGQRQDLHAVLAGLYSQNETPCVKYQPGPSVTLKYPAIVYKLDDIPAVYANNRPYHWDHRYEVQVIDRDPDSPLREKMKELPMCKFARSFVAENLYHFVFHIYY